jgi:hypothetical protein
MASQEPGINEGINDKLSQISLDINKLKAELTQIKTALKNVFSTIQEQQDENVVCIFCLKQQQWCQVGHYLCLDCDKEHIKINYACDFYISSRECCVHNSKIAYKEDWNGY